MIYNINMKLDIDESITDKKLLDEFQDKKDYEKVVIPFLKESKKNGDKVNISRLTKIIHDAHTLPISILNNAPMKGTSEFIDEQINKNLDKANKIINKEKR